MRRPKERDHVLANLKDLVVKEVHGAGGYGMLIGPAATQAQIEDFRGSRGIKISSRLVREYVARLIYESARYACALSQLANPDETIEVPSVGDRPARRLARQTLAEIVEPRYEELFGLIREELRRSGFEEVIAAGIVLTGGSAKMEGAIELAEEVFHVPVRLGMPVGVRGLADVTSNPIHSTGVGLLLYGRDHLVPRGSRTRAIAGNARSMVERMRDWFQGNF
ncbi:MAG: hypothetical protein EBT64_08130 [Gammaproteobacteria bacterium]|nr:hypothetical protein [Gammaproteobacteria bacterium]